MKNLKRKLLVAVLATTAAICGVFGLAACGDDGISGTGGITDNIDNTEHKHALTLVEGKQATCTSDGNSAYYTCNGCDKLFLDADGEIEVSKLSVVISKLSHSLTPVEAKAADCTTDGNTAYYTCGVCDKWFLDESANTEIADKNSVLIAKGHKYENGTCQVCNRPQPPTEGLEFIDNGNYCTVKGIGTAKDTSIVIPSLYNGKPVKYIGYRAFKDCINIKGVIIPDSVDYIYDGAFSGCSGLTSVTIPDSVTSIGGSAFYGCNNLENLTIPDSVTNIGDNAFKDCNKIVQIENGVHYLGKWLVGCNPFASQANIKDGIKGITDLAFNDCKSLKSVTIPDSVTIIGSGAFSGCSSLTSATIPDSVTEIGGAVFANCTNLVTVKLSNKTTGLYSGNGGGGIYIGFFYNCISLESITIPDSVTLIDDFAFFGCIKLKNIQFEGAKEKWNTIKTGTNWNYNTADYTIHCTDGDIEK